MDIKKQIEELRLHFDTELIHNETQFDVLTPQEYTDIKIIIKTHREDGPYPVSHRLYIQLMDSQVFLYSK